jgi:hypothetical protein
VAHHWPGSVFLDRLRLLMGGANEGLAATRSSIRTYGTVALQADREPGRARLARRIAFGVAVMCMTVRKASSVTVRRRCHHGL